MDVFRSGGLNFHAWVETFNLENMPAEERERFLSNLSALSRNSALTFLLNRLEAEALNRMSMVRPGDGPTLAQAQADVLAVRRLQALITAATQDQRLSGLNLAK
jgi:hypothetical protein